MKNVFTYVKPVFPAVLFVLLIGTASWQVKSKSTEAKQNIADTVKPNNNSANKDEFGIKDFDKAMKDLDEAMKKLEIEMKKFDGAKLEKDIKEAMSKIDFKKMNEDIKASMAKIDWSKIHTDVEKSLKEAELRMKDIDMSKLDEQMKELQVKLEKQQLDLKINGEQIRENVEKNMEKAKKQIEKAKVEIKNLKEFTDELEKDGLIDKKKGYKVQLKDGDLYINGTKQSKETTEKYKKYYKKDHFTINTDGDSIIDL